MFRVMFFKLIVFRVLDDVDGLGILWFSDYNSFFKEMEFDWLNGLKWKLLVCCII